MNCDFAFPGVLAAMHQLQDAAIGLRVVFTICLLGVIFAGLIVIKKRKELFGRDPHVTADTWASRNLRLWQVILVWILAMDLLITMLWRIW
jgi:hypothetical protein